MIDPKQQRTRNAHKKLLYLHIECDINNSKVVKLKKKSPKKTHQPNHIGLIFNMVFILFFMLLLTIVWFEVTIEMQSGKAMRSRDYECLQWDNKRIAKMAANVPVQMNFETVNHVAYRMILIA